MAIEDYKITTEEINEKHVEAQPDELTGTPDENKSVFDTLVEFVVEKLNGLIDFLAGNFISASQISDGLSTDVDNNVKWKYEIVKGESQGINFSGTVNYNTKTIIKSSPLPFLTLRNAIVKIGDTEYLMDNGVFATESYAEYDGKFRLSSDATNTYITILDEAFSTAIGTYLTIEVYVTSATTVPAKSLPLVVGEATGDYLQEQIGDMALSTVATDLTGAINETHNVPLDIQELYKPLIAPLSVSLTGFVEGSYLLYGKFYDELRVFVKVSKTTAMPGSTKIGALPVGYRPAELQWLNAYDEDGNIIADAYIAIWPTGEVYVSGVDANTVIFASYKGE
jgi:hypothetical protein